MAKRAKRLHEMSTGRSPEYATATSDHDTIAVRAYQLWLDRGCPVGSDQEDWFRAEEELRSGTERAA